MKKDKIKAKGYEYVISKYDVIFPLSRYSILYS
jgi:hypothetical protein